MKNTDRILKPINTLLLRLGLSPYALKIYRVISRFTTSRFTATIDGIDVQFSTEDEYSNSWFFPRYAWGRLHEREFTEMLIETLRDAKCFVDVGANLGWYTCLACKHMPQSFVYGFEMDDLNFALLQKNIAINNCTNVEVHNLAVSDSSAILSYIREVNRPSPLFKLYSGDTDKNLASLVSVNSITLDEFFENKERTPDVVKIDVEGAEMNVLRGMKGIIRESRPKIFLEVHPHNLSRYNTQVSAILSLLTASNYEVFEIEDMRAHEPDKQLTKLSPSSVLKKHTRLYAEPAE